MLRAVTQARWLAVSGRVRLRWSYFRWTVQGAKLRCTPGVVQCPRAPARRWSGARFRSASGDGRSYLEMTSLQGVSRVKLARDLGVTQTTAWFMRHRITEAFAGVATVFDGPVEVDESYFGGLEKNKPEHKRLKAGRGTVGKTAVVAAKDRATNRVAAKVVEKTDKDTLQGFVEHHVADGVKVYTDEHRAYDGLLNREAVKHSVGERTTSPPLEKVSPRGSVPSVLSTMSS